MKCKILCFVLGMYTLSFTSAFAAPTQTIPSTVLPEQATRALAPMPQPNPQALAPERRTSAPPANSLIGSEAAKIKFKLTKIILSGNTVYSDKQLLQLYKHKLNTTISVLQLQEIVQSITNFYRNNGYILTRAILPPQRVEQDGVVRVRVIEGFISSVNVIGKPRKARYLLDAYGDHIEASKPLQLSVMENYLLLANEVPGVETKAVIEPSKTKQGASDLNLVANIQTASGYLSYDNYGTLYVGPIEIAAGGELDSIFRSGDSTQINYATTSKGNELSFFQLLHNTPLGTKGVRLIVAGNQAKTSPGASLSELFLRGKANTYYGMIQYPLVRTRSKNVTLDASFNYIDSQVLITPAQSILYLDHLRTLRIGGNFNSADATGTNAIATHVETGLPILGATTVAEGNDPMVQTSHYGASNHFTRLDLELSRLQQLGRSRFSTYGIIKGQYAFEPLLATEQMSYGGVQQALGRGYDAGEIIGDMGLAGSVELRASWDLGKKFLQSTQLYGFYDAGVLWNRKNIPDQQIKLSATSTGVGSRLYFMKNVLGNFLIAKPLTRKVAAYEANHRNSRAIRIFFGLTAMV